MPDILTQSQRHKCMSSTRGKNTKPEILVRKGLHARGFRFRLHNKKLPGSPDVVLPKYGAADTYVQHLLQFSLRLRSQHAFEGVMYTAASVSPSVRYYLLLEYCNRNAGNLPQNVKDQCSAVRKELKDVILFPKDSKGQSQVMHRKNSLYLQHDNRRPQG